MPKLDLLLLLDFLGSEAEELELHLIFFRIGAQYPIEYCLGLSLYLFNGIFLSVFKNSNVYGYYESFG